MLSGPAPKIDASRHLRESRLVADVRASVLVLLGSGDERVPPSQGRQYVSALQAQPSPPRVEVNEYPGEGHSLAGAEANAHAVQSAVAFLREHLTK